MRALVTGCAGFIGSTLVDSLLDRGDSVRGIDAFTDYYDASLKRANIRPAVAREDFELIEADLRSCSLAELLRDVDVIFHLAGQPGVRVSWSTGFPTYVEHNVLATQRLLEAAREVPVQRLVFASSSSIYGNAAAYPTTESTLPRPHSPYGVTKLAAEHLCSLYAANYSVPCVSLRYFTVYGPRQRPDMGFARFLRSALEGAPISVFGDGEQIRDFTYVSDVVDATIRAGVADVPSGAVFNIAGGAETSVNGVIRLIENLVGHSVSVERFPEEAGDVRRTGATIELAGRALGWQPSVPLRDGIAEQLRSLERPRVEAGQPLKSHRG